MSTVTFMLFLGLSEDLVGFLHISFMFFFCFLTFSLYIFQCMSILLFGFFSFISFYFSNDGSIYSFFFSTSLENQNKNRGKVDGGGVLDGFSSVSFIWIDWKSRKRSCEIRRYDHVNMLHHDFERLFFSYFDDIIISHILSYSFLILGNYTNNTKPKRITVCFLV